MVSKQTKRKALTIKKIAEDSNPKRMDNKPHAKEGTYGINLNTRALRS
jgi:hypothetical protein